MALMLEFHKIINNHPEGVSFVWSLIYLLISRPFYICGFSLIILPIILGNISTRPIRRILAHEYWVPQSRLVYGVFLSNSIFMQFKIYNSEHGIWVQQFDAFLLYMAFLTFSFLFSFLTYLIIDGPTSILLKKLFTLDKEDDCNEQEEEILNKRSGRRNSGEDFGIN